MVTGARLTADTISQPLVHFERLTPYIEEALEYADGTHTLDDVRQGIESGHLQLWPCPTSCIITQINIFPHQKELHFFLAGGNLDELRPVYPIIEEWGRSIGCTRATFIGRKGWERVFMREVEGWSAPLVYYTKDLQNV